MAMGKREAAEQRELFVMADKLPQSPGHVFYDKLNRVLREGGFDRHVESFVVVRVVLREGERPAFGAAWRLLSHVDRGLLQGINSQRGIAWRCSDSLSLRKFLGIALQDDSPDHSSLTYIRNRLPFEVPRDVFIWILALAQEKKPLKGKTVAVDSTTLEANAAMKSIERKDTGEDWNEYLARLMKEEGLLDNRDDDDPPNADELQKFDKSRDNKRTAKMKDGTTHDAPRVQGRARGRSRHGDVFRLSYHGNLENCPSMRPRYLARARHHFPPRATHARGTPKTKRISTGC